MQERYENLRQIRAELLSLASRIRLSKDDFEATEFDLVEEAEDAVDEAIRALRAAEIESLRAFKRGA